MSERIQKMLDEANTALYNVSQELWDASKKWIEAETKTLTLQKQLDNANEIIEKLKADRVKPHELTEDDRIAAGAFWGRIKDLKVQDELADFYMILGEVSEVYMHFTDGALSKPNHLAVNVIDLGEESIAARIAGEVEPLEIEIDKLETRIEELEAEIERLKTCG